VRQPRPKPQRALEGVERQIVLDLLRAPRFADQAPAEIYACLLDEGVYHCSIRTMYRILVQSQEVRERRNQLRHPIYKKPELLAQAPNEVWSWDITKLMGPAKWSYFYLYVIIDIFSRRVVGWCVADRESATVFAALFDDATTKNPAPKGQLTLHADRGGPMRAKATALLLADLGVTKSHSRECRSARPVAEVVRPAKQSAVQRVAHFGPWIVVARHQQIANLRLEPLHALLGRARAQIPMTVRFVTVRSERVAEEVEAFL